MKEIIAKTNKTKGLLLEKINKMYKPYQLDSSRKNGRRIKSIKSEMKIENSQQRTQKYKRS